MRKLQMKYYAYWRKYTLFCDDIELKCTKWGALNNEKWILAADKQSNDVVEQQWPH